MEMRIIVPGDKNIPNLLPGNLNMEAPAKKSRYVLRKDHEDGTLLCNTLTGELALLSHEETVCYDAVPSGRAEELRELYRHHFLVPEQCREEQTVEQIRLLFLKRGEARGRIRHYNILPTTFCNARCFYCYQSGYEKKNMTPDTAEELAAFIAGHCDDKPVKLSWFGGEPTVGLQRIDQICRLLDQNGVSFYSDMTSNAYLFDEELIRHAKEAWKLKTIQITLDGTEEIYNRTKAYAGAVDNPYRRVLRNIGLFLGAKIHVDIRLNMDSHNAENLEALIEELSALFGHRDGLYVYVRQLIEDDGYEPIRHSPAELERLQRQLIRLNELLESKGWSQYQSKELPRLRVNICMADDPYSLQCAPDGILGKCEDQIYTHTVGTLRDGITDQEQVRYWQQRIAFDGCTECPLYPSCTRLLRNCPVKKSKCTEYERRQSIEHILDLMERKYLEWKRNGTESANDDVSDETGRADC